MFRLSFILRVSESAVRSITSVWKM